MFLLECEALVVQGGVRGEKGRGGQGLALPAGLFSWTLKGQEVQAQSWSPEQYSV